ncbi:MAG: LPXTG cell wall anchor domain-containing protein, partial [Lactococcus plantarum]|nr:LPXTG cell wall anchor domain-containing protein [Lactococcus plantarum]
QWKSGKKWLCAGLMVTALATGGVVLVTSGGSVSHMMIAHADTSSEKAISDVTVEAFSQYSHSANGHNQGDVAQLSINQPTVSKNGDNTIIEGEIVRDHVGTENGTIRTVYKLIFDNSGVYKSGTINCYGGYETAKLTLVVGQKYEGSFKFLETSGGYSGSGSYIYPTKAGMTFKFIDLTGKLNVDKTTNQFGDNLPNSNYNFTGLAFDVYKKGTSTVFKSFTVDSNGKMNDLELPAGDYFLREKSSAWSSTGQTQRTDLDFTIEAGKTTTIGEDILKNVAVTGQVTISKSGVESGTSLWNGNYSLEGNTFKLTNQADGKTYFVDTNKDGKASIDNLPLGTYDITETKASNGFVNTFAKKTVSLSYKDQKTEVVFGQISGTNQEIKGENELLKLDKDTGKAESQGKAELKGAVYELVYLDDSTGVSPHKKGDKVKWSDNPKATLVSGEKVTESVINGKKVSHGDNIVVRVDGAKFNAYVGNLAIGKYGWQEINAPIGYTSDKTVHEFEIKKKDDKTKNIVTPQSKSLEQVIKAKISIQKKVEISGESAESGFNDIKFNLTPINDTKGEVQTITTGIKDDEDGYANVELVYGDWKLTEDEATAPKGYDLIKPIYIHMTTDPETDIITISASYHEDFSKPFSTRTFSQSDNVDGKNDNIKGTVAGSVSSVVPFISLSKINLTDKDVPTPPETPSIDVEKSNEKIPQAGQGKNSDKDDNLGKGDADTKATAVKLTDKAQTINFRVTNNGTETLTHIKVTDKTIEGKQDVKDIKWSYQGKALAINKDGEFELDGKLLELPVDGYVEASGTLDKLADGEIHADEATVSGKGAISGKDVGDHDKWYGEKTGTPTPDKPSLPMTGETKAKFAGLAGLIMIAVVAILKRKSIVKLVSRFK